MNDPMGHILPPRDMEDEAEIHGRPRRPADFEEKMKKMSVLERAKCRMMEQANRL